MNTYSLTKKFGYFQDFLASQSFASILEHYIQDTKMLSLKSILVSILFSVTLTRLYFWSKQFSDEYAYVRSQDEVPLMRVSPDE